MNQKILLVDDNEGDRRLIREYLSESGLEIELSEADSGEKALRLIKESIPDMVIIDTRLSGIDGFETCRQIKSIDKGIKAIIFTGNVDAVDATKVREAGADDYCVKTNDYRDLIETIKRNMEGGSL